MKLSHLAIGGLVAYLASRAYLLSQELENVADRIQVFIKGIEFPRMSNGALVLPIHISLDNHLSSSLKISNLFVRVYRVQDGGLTQIAVSQPSIANVRFAPEATTNFTVELKASTSTLGMQLFDIIKNRITGTKATFRVLTEVTVLGHVISLPPYEQTV